VAPNAQGRNDPCLCGSGKKYKKCCGRVAGDLVQRWPDIQGYQLHDVLHRARQVSPEPLSNRLWAPQLRAHQGQVLTSATAAAFLDEFISTVETQLASLCSRRSPLFWLSLLRRLPATMFDAVEGPHGPRNTKLVCERAILKYSRYENGDDWSVTIRDGARFRVVTDVTLQDGIALLDILSLATLYVQLLGIYLRVGKGASVTLNMDHAMAPFASPETEGLTHLYDGRVARYGTLLGNLGMLSESTGLQTMGILRPHDFGFKNTIIVPPPDCLPCAGQVDPAAAPSDFRRIHLGNTVYEVDQTNYIRTFILAPGLLEALTKTARFRNAFVLANLGLTPEELLFCILLVDRAQVELVTSYPSLWSEFRATGFCTHEKRAVRDLLESLARKPEFMASLPDGVRQGVRANKTEVIETFLGRFSFASDRCADSSLWPGLGGYLLIDQGDGTVAIDLGQVHGVLLIATEFELAQKESDHKKTKAFERDVRRHLERECMDAIRGFAFPVGYTVYVDGHPLAEIDVSPIVDDCLLWVECKTGRWSGDETRGRFRTIRNRWSRIALQDDSWLSQADQRAGQVASRREWDGGEIPAGVNWILPIVCSSRVEYIGDAKEMFFLTPDIPRICTPPELARFINEWNWRQLERKPFLKRVVS
jgi:hypothetical protein